MLGSLFPVGIGVYATSQFILAPFYAVYPELRRGALWVQQLAIDKNGDMFSHAALVVQHITTQLRMLLKDSLQGITERRRRHLNGGAIDMLCQVTREFNLDHRNRPPTAL